MAQRPTPPNDQQCHFWGREIGRLGHEVRLLPPAHVKPCVKRQRSDAADAEAIAEAAQRPERCGLWPVKSEEKQGAAAVFRVRELLIRQRTQTINALRGHLTEFGEVVPQGAWNVRRLAELVESEDDALPETARATLQVLVDGLRHLDERIAGLDAEIARRAREDALARRLMTIPGIGPLIATALATLAPPPETFCKARDFAAWLGLTPRQHSTGGKQRRQAAPWGDDQDGRALAQAAADHRRQQRHHQTAHPRRGQARHLARRAARAQAGDARARGTREQNGADRLGVDGPGRHLQGSGRGGVSRQRLGNVGA